MQTFPKFLITNYQIYGKEKVIEDLGDRLRFLNLVINDPYEVQRFIAFRYAIELMKQSLDLEIKQIKILKEEFKFLLIQILLNEYK